MDAQSTAVARRGVNYRVLGPLSAERIDDDGVVETLELGPPKQRAVLALLLLNRGRVVSTDRVIDVLWDEAPPPSALASVQAYVSNLRRLLRETAGASAPIVRRAQGYALDVAAERLDAARFTAVADAGRAAATAQQWEDALALAERGLAEWHGELLEDFRHETWVGAEARGLEELRTECREARITALLALGHVAPALVAAQELRAAHPRRDRACWLVMIALHRAGRSTEALDVYRAHSEQLSDELGLEPGSELRELEVAILRHDAALAAWPRVAEWTGAAQLQTPDAPGDATAAAPAAAVETDTGPLVGRAREIEVIDEVLADARAGQVRWLVLTGPAGIGKTELVEELVRRGQAIGATSAWGRCSEEDGAPPWWPLRELIRGLGDDPDRLLVPPSDADPDEARFALYERMAALLRSATTPGAPLIVVVDDVQWADRTSASCLAYLVGALYGQPLVIALTLREQEDTTAITPLLAALARHVGNRQLSVGPIDTEAVRELASRVAGEALDRAGAEELAVHTGGNPLFVSEYARLPKEDRARGDVPLAVRAVLGRRLGGLPGEVLEVLRAAAVCGDILDMRLLGAATGMDPDVVADRLDDAADEHVLVPMAETGGYAFAHGLVRQEILTQTPAMRRQRLHARIAQALGDRADGDQVSRRAQHLVAAMPLPDAAEVLEACRAAARVAEDRWSSESAAEWWAEALRAFDLLPDSDPRDRDALLVAQVAALARAGRGQTVLDVLDAGLLDAVRAGRTATIGRLAASLLRCAGAWPWTSYGEDPGPLFERLVGVERFVQDDPVAHVRVLAAIAVGGYWDADPTVPDEYSKRALRIAEELGDESVLADALVGRLLTYSGVAGHADESIEIAGRLAEMGHEMARFDATVGRSVASMAHLILGDTEAAERAVREAIIESDLLNLLVVRVQLRWMQGTLAAWRGHFEEAHAHYEAAGRVHAQTELYYAGSSVIARHTLARYEGTLAEADITGSPEPLPWGAAIAAARGELDAVAEPVKTWLDSRPVWVWSTLGHVVLIADACAAAGITEYTPWLLEVLSAHEGLIGAIGHVGVSDPVDLAAGRLHAMAGDRARAEELMRRALALAERAGGVPSAQRCRAALAALDPPA